MVQNKSVAKQPAFTPIVIDPDTLTAMQKVIDDCHPLISSNTQTFTDSVVIANGMLQLREFMNLPEVKKLVESMANTEIGFLTDRQPGKDKWDKKKRKYVPVVPYTYPETIDALIPPMLEGYRFTGNEINIISSKGIPVKKGKFRKVNEFSGVTDFNHSIGRPHKEYFEGQKENGTASMKCQASWNQDGIHHTLGHGDDVCIIAIEFDKYSGIDKLIGLADSKVFSRVLTRLTGKFTIEGEDTFENPNTIVINPKKESGEDKRPLPTKQETKPVETDVASWALPKDEKGLVNLYNSVLTANPDKEKELNEFIASDPIEGRPIEFYQDFIDRLKKIVS